MTCVTVGDGHDVTPVIVFHTCQVSKGYPLYFKHGNIMFLNSYVVKVVHTNYVALPKYYKVTQY